MGTSFGARLREQRERQGVTLPTIAAATKIKASLLEELERDNPVHWPTGIFRRSYVRAYASAIGLDPDPIVREFLTLYPDPSEEVSPVEALVKSADGAGRRPPTRLTYLLSSAMQALPSLLGSSTNTAPIASPSQASAEATGEMDPGEWAVVSRPPFVVHEAKAGGVEPALAQGRTAGQDLRQPAAGASHPRDETTPAELPEFELVPPPLWSPAPDEERVHAGASDPAVHADDQKGRQAVAASRAAAMRATFDAVADLCTRLARARAGDEVSLVLRDATAALDAVGVILWMRDRAAHVLRPVLSHGYPDDLLAQVPSIDAEAENAIGGAFRSGEARLVASTDQATGALAVPVLTPAGCTGVLAAEFRDGAEARPHMRSMLTILAAQLSMLVAHPAPIDEPT